MEAKLRKYYREFRMIWASFVEVVEKVIRLGGHVAIEWPASCAYWSWDMVREFVDKHGLSGSICNRGQLPCTSALNLLEQWQQTRLQLVNLHGVSARPPTAGHLLRLSQRLLNYGSRFKNNW